MLSQDKIKKMIRLAEYEQGVGRQDLPRVGLLKTDYIRICILKTLVSVILAVALFIGLMVVYHIDYILQNALNIPYAELGMAGGLVTLVLALISIGVAWKVAAKEYEESAVRAREYYQTLEELRELYQEEQEDSLP